MRLINVRTLEMEEYFGDSTPGYAILSHTWGSEEVSLKEWTMLAQSRKLGHARISDFEGTILQLLNILPCLDIEKKSGYAKIIACCEQAKRDGLDYAWVDTCCIDKTSSAELSEAINSMFQWYKSSKVCYGYLSDVYFATPPDDAHSAICNSRWFTRGWTLQEFLSPGNLVFFDSEWNYIPFNADLAQQLSSVTGIKLAYIDRTEDIQTASVAQRMSWASKRQTTRHEDMAYCLLGIFDVNMPLLYGEGDRAFLRLQEEIARQSEDHSYLAWGFQLPLVRDFDGLFARSPADFAGCADVMHRPETCQNEVVHMTNKGLRIRMKFWTATWCGNVCYAMLKCSGPRGMWLAFPIDCGSTVGKEAEIWRLPGGTPVGIKEDGWRDEKGWSRTECTVFLKRAPPATFYKKQQHSLGFVMRGIPNEDYPIQLYEAYPPDPWIPSRGVFTTYLRPFLDTRFLLKFASSHAPSSETEHVIVAIDFKGTMSRGPEQDIARVKPSSIRAGVILAVEIQQNKASGYRSLAETMLGEPTWYRRSAESIPAHHEAAIRGHILSVNVKEGDPWVISIDVARKS